MNESFEKLTNEAAVELKVILPLVQSLGYQLSDISPKHPVVFQEGRRGRKHEADFVLFAGPVQNEETSLLVIEAKPLSSDLDEARRQAESYALALRAPIVLTCDGNTLEVWQLNLARSSEKILSVPVSEVEARQGEIERHLKKEIVVAYCKALHGKRIVEATGDFGRYEDAELRRTLNFTRAVARRLKHSDGATVIKSSELAELSRSGALIVAASGIGKTSLSNMLLRSELTQRRQRERGKIPVHIPFPDLRSEESILSFAAKRLNAYNASVSEGTIGTVMQSDGVTLILDEFDKLPQNEQRAREAEIRLLLRDNDGQISIFVFSRVSSKPILPLPTYQLEPLDHQEKVAVMQMRGVDQAALALHRMPPLLNELCGNPLLLSLASDHYKQTGHFPHRIEQIFRTWLDRTIQDSTRDLAAAGRREQALGILANDIVKRRRSATEAMALLENAGLPSAMINDLVGCDAIVIDAGMVGFHHEALADYLRALTISRLPSDALHTAISSLQMERDSLFPILLMALLPSSEAQALLWKRLTHIEFGVYVEVLRYRADISARMPTADTQQLGLQFLGDLRDGVTVPLRGFFPALGEAVVSELAEGDARDLAVIGVVSEHSATYSFRPLETGVPPVSVSSPTNNPKIYGIDLAPSGLRLDSGRLLGLQHLRDALFEVVDGRHLTGRLEWATERLTSRLHYLRNKHGIALTVTTPLADWKAFLSSNSSQVVLSDWPLKFLFSIRTVLDDIDALQALGRNQLADDSPYLDREARQPELDQRSLGQKLDEHYRKMQIIYRELAEESFGAVKEQLGFYSALPVRWHITVVIRASSDRRGASIRYKWMPVAEWDQAGAEVHFGDVSPPVTDDYFDIVNDELRRLGRLTKYTVVSTGSRILSSLDHFNDRVRRPESSPLREACHELRRDLERLLSGIPNQDRARP